jgi:hypothetical protein
MKKVKAMSEIKMLQNQSKPEDKKAHIAIVKPQPPQGKDPGVGCRPTGVQ